MSETIHTKLPDGSSKELPKGSTALEVAKSISPRLAYAAKVSRSIEMVRERDQRQAGEAARPTQARSDKIP
jgi:hypothetical protein